jgi:outer membrane protein OmpA-like peptidoglycan-associated protein
MPQIDQPNSKILQEKSILADRMTVRGYNMTQPIATNTTEEGRQQNRRMEIEVTAAP